MLNIGEGQSTFQRSHLPSEKRVTLRILSLSRERNWLKCILKFVQYCQTKIGQIKFDSGEKENRTLLLPLEFSQLESHLQFSLYDSVKPHPCRLKGCGLGPHHPLHPDFGQETNSLIHLESNPEEQWKVRTVLWLPPTQDGPSLTLCAAACRWGLPPSSTPAGQVPFHLTSATLGKTLQPRARSFGPFPSFKVQNANAVGDNTVATDASRTAKMLNIIALVCGIILLIIFIALKATQS